MGRSNFTLIVEVPPPCTPMGEGVAILSNIFIISHYTETLIPILTTGPIHTSRCR